MNWDIIFGGLATTITTGLGEVLPQVMVIFGALAVVGLAFRLARRSGAKTV